MISLFLWRSFKNLKRWFSYRNDKNSEVFLRWFSFSEMSFFQKIQAMIFTFQWPQFLCLKISLFNDKENDIRSVMIRGKSPLLPKWGSRASHKRERTSRKEAPIIPKCRFRLSYRKWSSLSFRNACDKSKSKSNIILNDFFKWCPFSLFQNDDAVIIPKWPWDKSVKKSVINLYPFRNEGHQPSFRNDRQSWNVPHSEKQPTHLSYRKKDTASFRNEVSAEVIWKWGSAINLYRKSMINLYMISFLNDGHFFIPEWRS